MWDHKCFTGIDYAADRKENAIFSILNEYGDGWEPLSHIEKGNFDYLILNDIETRNPAVREEFKRWIKWYYETAPFDGLRLDAVKHNTLVQERPELAVTFVDNHDTQPLQSLEEFTRQWFKPHAYAMILLRDQGYPCVFYPDLYGSCYS